MNMTLRAVEMQIAIPRTQDAGKVQDQLHGRQTHEQFLMASEQQKEREINRKRSETMEKSKMQAEREKNHSGRRSQAYAKTTEKHSEPMTENLHPYKGKIVDITL
jgi:hypothetical protein